MSRRLAVLSLAAALAAGALIGTAAAETVGEVEIVTVWAYGTPPGAGRDDLFPNNTVESGELVETVKTGELRIEFLDGTTLALGSQSAMVLDELVYDPATAGNDSLQLQLTQGFFHFVTGDVEAEAVVITTPTMIIGVRGTDLAISVGSDGSTELGVRSGEATATPTAGGPTVSVGAGKTASTGPGDTAVSVRDGLSSAAAGTMPASGAGGGGGLGSGEGGGGGAGSGVDGRSGGHNAH